MMVVGSLVTLAAKPELFTSAWKMVFRKRTAPAAGEAKPNDPLRDIELPLWVSFVGVPIKSFVAVWLTHDFFGAPRHLALIAQPLIFFLAVICTNSIALTSRPPTGSLSEIT